MLKRWCTRTVIVFASVLVIVGASGKVPVETAVIVLSGSVAGAPPAPAQSTRDAAGVTKVNLNTATQQELQTLRGIGPATAKRIIRNRPYAATAELSRAEVAGPIIELISLRVTVGPAPAQ